SMAQIVQRTLGSGVPVEFAEKTELLEVSGALSDFLECAEGKLPKLFIERSLPSVWTIAERLNQQQYQHHARGRNESGQLPNTYHGGRIWEAADAGWNLLRITSYPVSWQKDRRGCPL
ncbi:MAG TPA: hypothetical protein VFI45_18690, partial [Candidatus Acidoferrum sp.]|nr:hypothetical protein [Candidatus Acidoferrum sp.]